MKAFAALFTVLDQTTGTTAKVTALTRYFQTAPDDDKLWTIALFTGRRPRRVISTTLLRLWAAEAAGIPLWLFEDAYPIVGDLAETIALIGFDTWPSLTQSHAKASETKAEGVMLKRLTSPYAVGRKRGDWWKWKRAALTIDAVMIYAQQGHGRRATLFTDFTFAVWDNDTLVPFTKAYSGLTDAEFAQITAWVRKNTLQRFGPVRQVTPTQVFEIAFEGIQSSPRHKSGIALRFPRISRWRHDKSAAQANTLDDLRALLAIYG